MDLRGYVVSIVAINKVVAKVTAVFQVAVVLIGTPLCAWLAGEKASPTRFQAMARFIAGVVDSEAMLFAPPPDAQVAEMHPGK